METINNSGKSAEKLREERKNYLSSQIKTLDLQIGEILESQEYKDISSEIQEKIWKVRDDYVAGIRIHHKSNAPEYNRLVHERDTLISELENERSKTDPYQKVILLENNKRVLSEELNGITSKINTENVEAKTLQIKSTQKELDELLEAVFTKLDSEQEVFLKPLTDFGMKAEAALENLKSTDRMAYGKIYKLQENLSQLESMQNMFSEVTPSNFDYNTDTINYVTNQIEVIKNNL